MSFGELARKQRGIAQKLYLVETLEIKDEDVRKYVIMGSTGNVYTVTISNCPNCTCPDYMMRFVRCKHIFFVLIRIMKVEPGAVNKKKYLEGELKIMFSNIPEITKVLCVSSKAKEKYVKLAGGVVEKSDDVCPICLDDIKNGEEYEYCKAECGKCVHKGCFAMWCLKSEAKCLVCGSQWGVDKYVNLTI
ncbi:MAG: hypothetical protein Hyperionvirus33_13 [Hyperionvirus sp.]|uniref:SWIM-type domain-containing protein n=1 Tax=Hyperionvirus sp. TaxID=2487770 RepID=A0A3G5ABV3_9VIRU|nr:MAG: hypothetical protein Hyperionvirus33_13 [Hyperionvirus sp.]